MDLLMAAATGHVDNVRKLLISGSDPNFVDEVKTIFFNLKKYVYIQSNYYQVVIRMVALLHLLQCRPIIMVRL
jgi:hypothetical protein